LVAVANIGAVPTGARVVVTGLMLDDRDLSAEGGLTAVVLEVHPRVVVVDFHGIALA
jgi:hypothetical protein